MASLIVLGTAATAYWQPLSARITVKPSDVIFAMAIAAGMVTVARTVAQSGTAGLQIPGSRTMLPALLLLASLLFATLLGDRRYGLAMSRDGTVLLARLAACLALFAAAHQLARSESGFTHRISLALLTPVIALGGLFVPWLWAAMWEQDRFRGLTVNPNTAALGFTVALAFAYTLSLREIGARRPGRAAPFAAAAAVLVALIVWTQSRAYLAAGLAALLTASTLLAPRLRLPRLQTSAIAAGAFVIAVSASVLVAPRPFGAGYLERLSGNRSPAAGGGQPAAPPARQSPEAAATEPAGEQWLAWSNWTLTGGRVAFRRGEYGMLRWLDRLPPGLLRRVARNAHLQAAMLYLGLVPQNPFGLGVNYEEKFFLYFPWINGRQHGTNSILDLPIYGGIGAVVSIVSLGVLIVRRTRDRLRDPDGETHPYAIAAASALTGLWAAALVLGSPIFDYQFWIVAALALA